MNRRTFLQTSLPGAAAAVVSCARTEVPRGESLLRVGAGADRYNTSPGRFSLGSSHPNVRIVETPVRPDAQFRPVPLLFERWTHDGGGHYTAHLRQGVAFHDGTPLSSDVFVRSAKEFIATRDFIGLDPDSLRTDGETTVRFRSLSGSALMVDNMTHPAAALFLPSDTVRQHPVGTGPYRFVRYEPKRQIEVERFAGYWGRQPRHARVHYRFLTDPQARLLALQAGEVDLVSDVVPEMLLGLAPDDPRVVVRRSRPIRYAALLCNLRGDPPFDTLRDVRVRRALALAIDREAIARVLYQGHGVVARGVLPGWMFGLGEDQPRGFSLDRRRAADLLDEAGWREGPDGKRSKAGAPLQLRLVSAFPNASAVKPMPEMLAQMFATVGVDTEIIEVEDSQLYYSGYADRGQADLFLELAANANADPTFLLFNVFHSGTPWMSYRYHAAGPSVDGLIDEARRGTNPEAIVNAVREAHRRIIDEHVAAIPILMAPAFVLTRPDVVIEPYENLDWVNFGDAQRTT
ncbi:MAG: ABC transporter substrate-binding protein [Bryobacterales bacterium]|nr:ABC transporter substrate-binding protein [Bryobacterales bacterium]